jgi:hypothetical protein
MIKAYLAAENKFFNVTQYSLFPTIDSTTWDPFYAFIGTYWKNRTQPFNVSIRFSEQYPDNYLEVNGRRITYKEIEANYEKVDAILQNHETLEAIEALP